MGTVLQILATGNPRADHHVRPKQFFGVAVRKNCKGRAHFDAGEFLTD